MYVPNVSSNLQLRCTKLRTREREREQNDPDFNSTICTYFAWEFHSEWNKQGKKIYKNRTDKKKRVTATTEFKNKFLRKRNSVIFPAGNTRSLLFWILVQLTRQARFHGKTALSRAREKKRFAKREMGETHLAGWLAK